MEVCSLHSSDTQGYEMKVGSLLDQLPDYKNIRKNHSKYPTNPSTSEMKRSHSEREGNSKKPPLSLGNAHKISTQSQKTKEQQQPSPAHVNATKACEIQHTNNNTCTSKVKDCAIYLGGSCNPTTWRTDIAIPILSHSGISFFNPQVACWYPELIAAEHEAKDLANVLFFVIDTETRAVASMVEVAYLIAQGKNVILVISALPRSGHEILGEPITESEIDDLRCAQTLLRNLASWHEIRVFECIRTALSTTAATLIQNHVDSENPKQENGKIQAMTVESVETTDQSGSNVQQFLCQNQISIETLPKTSSCDSFDVFLGGVTCESWRIDIAIPLLKKNDLSFWSSEDSTCTLMEDKRMQTTSMLFFYLNCSSRALEPLILAAYYVGLRSKNVVLCIENLNDGCVVAEELLSKTAIKDYNRGRSYLRDVAERLDVPIFSSLTEALNSLVEKLKQQKLQS